MAVRTDDVVVNLLINETEGLKSLESLLSGLDNIETKTRAVGDFATEMANKYATSASTVLTALKQISKESPGFSQVGAISYLAGPQLEKEKQVNAEINAAAQESLNLQKQITAEQKKQAAEMAKLPSFEQQRVYLLKQAVIAREKEVMAIKEMQSYSQQVSATQKLIGSLSKETGSNFQQVANVLKNEFGLSAEVAKSAVIKLENGFQGLGGILNDSIGNFKSWANTLFGIFTAMFAFQLVQLVSQFFSDALKNANEFVSSVNKLNVAEQILSENGIEIGSKKIEDALTNLSKQVKIISKTDLRGALGDILNQLSEFGGGVEDALKLEKVAIGLSIQFPEKDFNEIRASLVNTLLSGASEWSKGVGLNLSDAAMQEKALALGIDKTVEQMNEQEKYMVRLALITDQQIPKYEKLIATQDDLSRSQQVLAATWKDTTTAFGLLIKPFVDGLASSGIAFLNWANSLIENTRYVAAFVTTEIVTLGVLLQTFLAGGIKSVGDFKRVFFEAYEAAKKVSYDLFFPQTTSDTPTVPSSENASESEKNTDKIEKNLQNLAEAMDEFGDKARKMSEDFNIAMRRLWEDYQRKVFEINRDANDKVQDANRKFHNAELDNEAKFLEKLRQLREKFLFNLEDALRERDARQVIRLTRQYEMDKQALINEEALRKQNAQRQHEDELKQIRDDRNRRLEDAAYEYNLKKKRDEENYRLEMQRLKEQLDDKLREIANNIAQELKLNQKGADDIYRTLKGIYGPGSAIDALVKYTYDSMIVRTQTAMDKIKQIAAIARQAINSVGSSTTTTNHAPSNTSSGSTTTNHPNQTHNTLQRGAVGMASGGLIVAHRPTNVIFGERGKEAGLFMPLDKFMGLPGIAGLQEKSAQGRRDRLELMIDINPNLKAEIVNQSLDEVSVVLDIVKKGK